VIFVWLAVAHIWQSNCEYEIIDFQFAPGWYAVLGELISIPTDTLIDMLFVIVNGEVALTAKDVAEIEQIQRELQSRGEDQYWSLRAFDC
jgi:hypothetical protein